MDTRITSLNDLLHFSPDSLGTALLFDYGGTLDTGGRHWADVIWQAYRLCGATVSEEQFREAYIQTERHLGTHPTISPTDDFRATLHKKISLQAKRLPVAIPIKAIAEHCHQTALAHTQQAADMLRQLKEHHRLALVTNFYGNIHAVLSGFGLDGIFDLVVESATVGIRKPDTAIWQLAIDRLGLAPRQCTVIGDSLKNDILPARQLGCPTIQLLPT